MDVSETLKGTDYLVLDNNGFVESVTVPMTALIRKPNIFGVIRIPTDFLKSRNVCHHCDRCITIS